MTLFRAAGGPATAQGGASMDQRSNRAPELDVDAAAASARAARARPTEHSNDATETDARAPSSSFETRHSSSSAASLLFLGTGSAEPSKYRGSSGVLVKLPPDSEPHRETTERVANRSSTTRRGTYALLDCGEGAAGAFRRFLGDDEGGRCLDELRFVFITHHHPDHMAGILGVLAARSPRAPPLRVLGPSATLRWLRRAVEVGAVGAGDGKETFWTQSPKEVDDGVARLAAFTHTTSLYARDAGSFGGPFWIPPKRHAFPPPPPIPSSTMMMPMASRAPPPPPPPPPLPPHPLCASLGLSRLEAVPVEHCPEASAVILAHPGGFSLCYSGDCRPSRRLAAAARGVQVLVHEATFADDLRAHAERKRHSTVSEALRVAGDADAGATILTHFSQRYPKAVTRARANATVAEARASASASSRPVVCAFDGMLVRSDALGSLAETAREVDAMFEAAEGVSAEAEAR